MQPPFRILYDRLYEHFGPQGWWPTTPLGETRPRYYPGRGARSLSTREQWEIVVGAILTQNTAWHNAEQALHALCARRLLDLAPLSSLDRKVLAGLIRPSGYYNQKTRKLKQIARYILAHYGDTAALLERPLETLRPELLALNGIGPETADSILLYAAQYPTFVVDAYTRRICARLGLVDASIGYSELQARFARALPSDPVLFNEFHALLVKHATTYCKAEPLCRSCCLRRQCPFPGRRKKDGD